MSERQIRNLPASVHQRLLNKARETGRPFNELLQYYAMERFLYRLSESSLSDRFVLKGALLLSSLSGDSSRPTRDIDLLGTLPNALDEITSAVKEICTQSVQPDGISFDADTVEGEVIVEHAEYEGVRVRFVGHLATAVVSMQVDVGFGDIVSPAPVAISYPTLLEFPPPDLQGYTPESVIAEKYETMVKLGIINSRLKDFYDLWKLSRQFGFDGATLAEAISGTFAQRGTDIPTDPGVLLHEVGEDPVQEFRWTGFLRNNRLDDAPDDLLEVVVGIGEFLEPVSRSLAKGEDFNGKWSAPGPWTE